MDASSPPESAPGSPACLSLLLSPPVQPIISSASGGSGEWKTLRYSIVSAIDVLRTSTLIIAQLQQEIQDYTEPSNEDHDDPSFTMDDPQEQLTGYTDSFCEPITAPKRTPSPFAAQGHVVKRRKKSTPVSNLSADDFDDLLDLVHSEELDVRRMLAEHVVTPRKLTLPAERRCAIEAALLDFPTGTDWDSVVQLYMKSPQGSRELCAKVLQDYRDTSEAWTPTEFCDQYTLIAFAEPAAHVDAWFQSLILKILAARFSRRWWSQTTHDPQFANTMYRQLWARTTAGHSGLNGRDIETYEVREIFAKELKKYSQSVSRTVAAHNKLLNGYARFGAIVFLHPRWTLRAFKNENFAPTSQSALSGLYTCLLQGDNPIPANQPAIEASILALVKTIGGDSAVEIIGNYLWELRKVSLLPTNPVDFAAPTDEYLKYFAADDILMSAAGKPALP